MCAYHYEADLLKVLAKLGFQEECRERNAGTRSNDIDVAPPHTCIEGVCRKDICYRHPNYFRKPNYTFWDCNTKKAQGNTNKKGRDIDPMASASKSWRSREAIQRFTEPTIPFLRIKVDAKMIAKASCPKDTPMLCASDIAILESGCVLVADADSNQLIQFDEAGKFLFSHSSQLSKPEAIVDLENGKFAVKDESDIRIFFNTFVMKSRKKYSHHKGLTADDNGNLVTIKPSIHGVVQIVTVDSETCDFISKINVSLDLTPMEVRQCKPLYIDWQGNRRLLISDVGCKCVYIVDTALGSVVTKIASHHIKAPAGIICDTDGFILIADNLQNSVLLYNPYGKFLCSLNMDVITKSPSGIRLTKNGHLFVLSRSGNYLTKYRLKVKEVTD